MRRMQIGIAVACALAWAATAGVARAQDAATTTVTCKDGTTGTAGKGACSHHGGVNKAAATAPAATTSAAAAPAATAPAATTATGATVTCKDGTTGTAGKGACSHHGGVGTATTASAGSVAAAPATKPAPTAPAAAPAKPAPTTPAATAPAASPKAASTGSAAGKTGTSETTDPTGAIAQCKDGLYSHSTTHTGTCSRHGGVAKWLDGTAPQ